MPVINPIDRMRGLLGTGLRYCLYDISYRSGLSGEETFDLLEEMLRQNEIELEIHQGKRFYRIHKDSPRWLFCYKSEEKSSYIYVTETSAQSPEIAIKNLFAHNWNPVELSRIRDWKDALLEDRALMIRG